MFKKAKWKFILIALASILGILVLILGFVNIENYIAINKEADNTVQIIINNGGHFPEPRLEQLQEPGKSGDVDLPFRSRFFTVYIKSDGSRIYQLDKIASITKETAAQYTTKALKNNDAKGYIEDFRYGFNADKTLGVFLDCSAQLKQTRLLLNYSVGFTAGGLLVFFVLLYFTADKVIKPLRVAVESQNEFITNSSHELKTPLTVININTELIEMQNGKSEATDNISHEVSKLKEMVDEMMKLSKMNELKEIKLKRCPLDGIISSAKEPFIEVYNQKSLKFNVKTTEGVIVKTEENLLTELITICLDNAAKYAKTYVNLQSFVSGNEITITIENDSEFTKEGNLNYLKGRFVRDDDARTKVDGSGIGLSLADKIGSLLKAKIDISGSNDVFRVEIKLKK